MNFDRQIMARTAIGEARGEGDVGMQAVMWTGLNRFTKKKWFTAVSIAGTFLKPFQYSCWLQHDPNYGLITSLDEDIELMDIGLKWADDIIKGNIPDPTLGATHYHADTIAVPGWVDGATVTVKIGRHIFYKDVD